MITEKIHKCEKCGRKFADRDRCYVHELTCGKKDCENCTVVAELAKKLIELESRIAALESTQHIITVPSPPLNPLSPNVPDKEFHWICTSEI